MNEVSRNAVLVAVDRLYLSNGGGKPQAPHWGDFRKCGEMYPRRHGCPAHQTWCSKGFVARELLWLTSWPSFPCATRQRYPRIRGYLGTFVAIEVRDELLAWQPGGDISLEYYWWTQQSTDGYS
jgi:hypothetical protein